MKNYSEPGRTGLRRLTYIIGILAALLVTTLVASKSGLNTHYPYALDAKLPNAAEAENLVAMTPWILRPFRLAHQESLQRGWKSVAPAVPTPEHKTSPATP